MIVNTKLVTGKGKPRTPPPQETTSQKGEVVGRPNGAGSWVFWGEERGGGGGGGGGGVNLPE